MRIEKPSASRWLSEDVPELTRRFGAGVKAEIERLHAAGIATHHHVNGKFYQWRPDGRVFEWEPGPDGTIRIVREATEEWPIQAPH